MSDQRFTANLLLIDNDREFHETFRFTFEDAFKIIDTTADLNTGLNWLGKNKYHLLLLDLAMDRADEDFESGLARIPTMRREYPGLPIIIVTNDKKRDTIIRALKNGADDFIYKGEFEPEKWINKIRNTIHVKRNLIPESIAVENKTKKKTTSENISKKTVKVLPAEVGKVQFIGETPEIQEIRRKLAFLAMEEENITLLVTGETGTGKEIAAKYFHQNSNRKNAPFQAVNLSTITDELLESELFGHLKGSFTNATRDKTGYFEQVNGGMVFLDEIGEISETIQIKLLRFMEDHVIRRIGSEEDIQLDVQIIAATNKELKKEINSKNFRADFYERLSVERIHLPPLRERKEDIKLLIAHIVGMPVEEVEGAFTTTVWKKIHAYHWPRNVRELKNKIKGMVRNRKYLEKEVIDEECLPKDIKEYQPGIYLEQLRKENPDLPEEAQFALARLRKIEDTLISCSDKKGLAAKKLGKDTDGVRYEVKTYFERFPNLFEDLKHIKKVYSKTLKKIDPNLS